MALREPADAAARATELLVPLRSCLPAGPLVIRDLGCGTGSMGRWLAGRLPGPQHWIGQDRDPDLLALLAARTPASAADGSPVTVNTEIGDITQIRAAHLIRTSLVTTSAVLDLLTADEVDGIAAACADAGCPALLALSVTGQVELSPADPLDAEIGAAFNAHQRRVASGRQLLGPDAPAAVTEAFARHGARVHRHPSPWRLGADQAELVAEWLQGWVSAATEQRPDLTRPASAYLRRRLAACAAGELRVVVGHEDLLAIPAASVGADR